MATTHQIHLPCISKLARYNTFRGRNSSHSLKAYSPMTFQLSIQGGNEMNYRIEEKELFRIIGITKRVPIVLTV